MNTTLPKVRAVARAIAPATGRRACSPRPRAILALPLLVVPMMGGCSYVDQARHTSDVAADIARHYQVEGLVQADIERKRLRAARCLSPLLTPTTLSTAATDERLGTPWVDELLHDCPQFATFLSELTMRRARESGLMPVPAAPALPIGSALPGSPAPAATPWPVSSAAQTLPPQPMLAQPFPAQPVPAEAPLVPPATAY